MVLSSNIRAVTFDVGGTLLEPWPSVGHVYAEMAARHGYPGIPAEELTRRFRVAWRGLKDFRHTREQWAALVDATFVGLVPEPPSQTFFPPLYDRFTEPSAWHVFDDVRPALKELGRRGLKLGIISNWDDRLRPLLRGLNLYDLFDVIVVSCEVSEPKPAAVIFQTAARELRQKPETILHVGDHPRQDVAGAKAAGLEAILLERSAKGSRPDRLNSLGELCP